MGRGLSSHARTILNLNKDVSAWSHQVMMIVLHSISQRHFTGRSNLSHFSKALSFTAQSRAHLLTLKADQNGGLRVQGWFSNTGSQTSRHAHQMKFSQGQKRSMTYNKRSKLASWCRPVIPATLEPEAGGSHIQGLPGLQSANSRCKHG